MTTPFRPIFAATLAIGAALIAPVAFAQTGSVNIYSYRSPDLIAPLLDAFTAKTGIPTNVLHATNGLIERVRAEGENTPADLILTVDIGNLALAKSLGVSQPFAADTTARAPEAYRDAENEWVALSLRARVFYVSRDRVDIQHMTYGDLANPEWKGLICTRSGQHVYNIGLIASRIAHNGVDDTREWLTHVRDNLGRIPTGDDRAQAKAILSGECDLAIGNTYYMGLMMTNEEEPEQKEWAAATRIIYPDPDGDGTHVNVSGAILTKYAPNKANAEALIKYLLSDDAQHLYASGNHEFPVVPGVPPSDIVASWGELHADTTPLAEIASYRDAASALVDEVRFDAGPQK